MNNEDAGWIRKVRAEEDKVPLWLLPVLEHPRFSALHRAPNKGGWSLFTSDEDVFDADTLREVCQKFLDRYLLRR